MFQNFTKVFLVFLVYSVSTNGFQAYGLEDVVLDVIADGSEDHWNFTGTQNYCVYGETDTDLDYAWGCPANLTGDGVSTTDLAGYWTPCKETTCDIIYKGAAGAKPFSVTIQFFLSQGSKIAISARKTNGAAFGANFGSMTSEDGNAKRISLTSFDEELDFKFTLTSASGGYAVIEHISMDMEEKVDELSPTEPTQGSGRGAPGFIFGLLAFTLVKFVLN